jgi:hypothetical protein
VDHANKPNDLPLDTLMDCYTANSARQTPQAMRHVGIGMWDRRGVPSISTASIAVRPRAPSSRSAGSSLFVACLATPCCAYKGSE